jgi:hypothetical protein
VVVAAAIVAALPVDVATLESIVPALPVLPVTVVSVVTVVVSTVAASTVPASALPTVVTVAIWPSWPLVVASSELVVVAEIVAAAASAVASTVASTAESLLETVSLDNAALVAPSAAGAAAASSLVGSLELEPIVSSFAANQPRPASFAVVSVVVTSLGSGTVAVGVPASPAGSEGGAAAAGAAGVGGAGAGGASGAGIASGVPIESSTTTAFANGSFGAVPLFCLVVVDATCE